MDTALSRQAQPQAAGAFTRAILEFVGNVPGSDEPRSTDPAERAKEIARSAARRAGVLAGTLALPPGPLGWLTILPELVAVWRIQAKMVADIAGCHGKTALLSREQMLYCLFRHAAAQAVRDLAVRAGERMLIRKASARVFEDVASRVGMRVTQRALGKGVARFIPALGALGVGGYAYWDTLQVGKTAADFFSSDATVER
jgi:hypothetical protein